MDIRVFGGVGKTTGLTKSNETVGIGKTTNPIASIEIQQNRTSADTSGDKTGFPIPSDRLQKDRTVKIMDRNQGPSSRGDCNNSKKSAFHDSDFSDSDDELLGSIPLDDFCAIPKFHKDMTRDLSKGNAHTGRLDKTKSGAKVKSGVGGNDVSKDSFNCKTDKINDSGSGSLNGEVSSNSDVTAMLRKVWGGKVTESKSSKTSVILNDSSDKNDITPTNRKRPSNSSDRDKDLVRKKHRISEKDHQMSRNKNDILCNYSDSPCDIVKERASNTEKTGLDSQSDLQKKKMHDSHISPDKHTSAQPTTVASPIEKLFNKIKDKHEVTDSASLKDSSSSPKGGNCAENSVTNQTELSSCPVCNKSVPTHEINDHLDLCLTLMAISE